MSSGIGQGNIRPKKRWGMGEPPERPKPRTSHTWINGVPEQPEPITTEIWDGPARLTRVETVAFVVAVLAFLAVGLLVLMLLVELLQMVGIGG